MAAQKVTLDETKISALRAFFEVPVSDKSLADLFHGFWPDQFIFDTVSKSWRALNEFGIWEKDGRDLVKGRKLNDELLPALAQYFPRVVGALLCSESRAARLEDELRL